MSAVNTSASDREQEAIRRAQRAHEPSMEEILASIRTIIAEERDPAKVSVLKGAAAPQVVYSKAEAAAQRAADATAGAGGRPKSAQGCLETTAARSGGG